MNQSKVISYYDNEQCSCASHWLRTNSPERLTKPFNSYSPWHQWWLAAAARFSAVSGWSHWRWEVTMPLGKLYPLAAVSMCAHWGPGPGSGSCWYRSQYGWGLAGPIGWDPSFPSAIISRCPLVDSCSLPLERDTDYLPLGPPEPLSH